MKESILAGACDYIVKPIDAAELLGTLRTAVAGADARRAAAGEISDALMQGMVGESPGMRELKELIRRYAPSNSPVLVLGESGTGKERAARLIHDASRRAAAALAWRSIAALFRRRLLESELFGAEKGAFTDAVSRPGSFERADGGTLFLDEVGEMSPAAQASLLRVIEQKELTRVGGTRTVPLDVRVVSASNRDLKADVVRREVPRRSLLPPGGAPDPRPAPSRATRRHSPPCRALSLPDGIEEQYAQRRDPGETPRAFVAGQHPRAAQRDGAGGPCGGRRGDPALVT